MLLETFHLCHEKVKTLSEYPFEWYIFESFGEFLIDMSPEREPWILIESFATVAWWV